MAEGRFLLFSCDTSKIVVAERKLADVISRGICE